MQAGVLANLGECLGDFTRLRVAHGCVSQAKDADHSIPVIADGKPPDLLVGHGFESLLDIVVGRTGGDVLAHDAADRRAGVDPGREGPHGNVAIGDDNEEIRFIDDRNMPT